MVDHLRELGIELDPDDVVTSAMAGAKRLAELLWDGSEVLAVGGEGVALALTNEGLTPVRTADIAGRSDRERPVAVLQGFGRDVAWTDLAEAAFAIQQGALWVATNADSTVPTDRGIAPGNGSLVEAVRRAVAIDPEVVGKPHPPLYLRCAERLGCAPSESLAIGDRLDTDIEGAVRTGMDSLFVLTGVNGPQDVILAGPEHRPTFLGRDLRVLHEPYEPAHVTEGEQDVVATCGGARASVSSRAIVLGQRGSASERLRAIVAAGVHHVDGGATLPTWPDVDSWIHEGDS
ncbi:HAD-IIA family hydrolase [Mobilicoccus caccae]|uniref:Uncharacterized protein n=1 Tax=Mobilicoccus caccae TaxID=1859295 RepID=A0ABQ6IRT5_9MICO|nr:HAD hydrolase-like protein [Mobilicoccus caccae]GMA39988.1 hypothetical protein GCM10025883_20330 [Mobilicoccus caccae]